MIGRSISHYRIIEKLGEGGMGEVYLAEDLKLERKVAIKFLPQHLTKDKENVERFEREAKAAASLNHPNIVTIYEIAEENDQIFIVMEYVKGKSLRDVINEYKMGLEKIIDIISQISEGLSKAHEAGIVHRDIKPENIIIDKDARVKILDFGLAKLKGVSKLTKDSSTLGTVHYMSPEQIQGKDVDQRSDIWSVGVVLYELHTGEPPFKGEYESAVHYAILNEELKELKNIQPEFGEILIKSLSKLPSKRYQYMENMLNDLKSLNKADQLLLKKRGFPKSTHRFLLYTLAVLLLLVLIIITYRLTMSEEEIGFRIIHTTPLTTAPGLEQDPTWSPDGTRIAYTSDESGNMDIWVRQITAGQRINLTKDHTGYDGKPVWSPNGEWIAFISQRDGGGIYIVPTIGGIPKRIMPLSFALSLSRMGIIPDISWSPNGSQLTYAIAGSLYTISSSGGLTSKLHLPPTSLVSGYSEPAWSPDGKRIACTGFVGPGVTTSQIWLLDRNESDPVAVTKGRYYDHNPVWSAEGRQLFFISDRGGSLDVWWISVNTRGEPIGSPQQLTAGAGIGAIALSKDGKKLAFTKIVERSNIWSIPIVFNRKVTLNEAQSHTSENHYIENLNISPDGKWIAFDSNRHGNMDIWIMAKDGTKLRQLTINLAHDWYPRWSPNGQKILFHSMRSGNRDLYEIPVNGGAVIQLTNHPAEDLAAISSPDGEKIAFLSNRSGFMNLWMILSSRQNVQQLTFGDAQDFLVVWSPDGKEIIMGTNRTGFYELFRIPEKMFLKPNRNTNPTQLTHGEWAYIVPHYWTVNGKTVFAYGVGGPNIKGANLWAISVADGSAQALVDFQGSLMEPPHSLSSDEERIYFPLLERIGDLWMAELEENLRN
jgi:serine/threonine protein kinase